MGSTEEVIEESEVEEIIDKAIEFLDLPEISHQPITKFKRLELDMPMTIEEYGVLRKLLMVNFNTYITIEINLPLDYLSLANVNFEKSKAYIETAHRIFAAFANQMEDFRT